MSETETAEATELRQQLEVAHARIAALEQEQVELRRADERLRTIARTVPHLLAVSRLRDGCLLFCNEALARFADAPAEQLLGRRTPDFYAYPEERAALVAAIERTGHIDGFEVHLRRGDGEVRLVSATADRLIFDGEPALMGVSLDITDIRRSEQALREATERQRLLLREVNHRVGNNLASLLSMLHHEQRSLGPSACVDAGAAGGSTSVVGHVLGKLEVRLQGLAGAHRLLSDSEWKPLRLTELAHRVIAASCRGIDPSPTLEVVGGPARVSSDQAQQLTLVFTELVVNSVKHGPVGRPSHLLVVVEQDAGEIRIEYRDSGPGYPAALLDAGVPDGLGLGLGLVWHIVRHSLHGKLALHSDGGAVAALRIPCEVPA